MFVIRFGLLMLSFACAFVHAGSELETVSYVNPQRYVGTWYEIASNPMPFTPPNCVCTKQVLSLGEEAIGVHNSCRVGGPQGPLSEIFGIAKIDDPVSNAKLTVDFNLGFPGKYWIIALDKYYRWAVVSDPTRRSLYILSKRPNLSQWQYQRALDKVADKIDLSRLVKTSQKGCK